jgi:hypothetical protein
MRGRPSILRSAALLCAAHARRVLLRRNQFWADGMEQEAHHIDDDWSALRWALGCVFASYAEVLKAERFFIPVLARLCLAAITLFYAQQPLSGMIGALECHLYDLPHGVPDPVALEFVYRHFFFMSVPNTGSICIAFDTPPFPLLKHAIQAVIGSLYLAAGLRIVQGRASAFPLFFGALVASLVFIALVQIVVPLAIHDSLSWYDALSWYWNHSPFRHHTMISIARNTWWKLIVCLCVGLVVSLDNKRKIAR